MRGAPTYLPDNVASEIPRAVREAGPVVDFCQDAEGALKLLRKGQIRMSASNFHGAHVQIPIPPPAIRRHRERPLEDGMDLLEADCGVALQKLRA